MATVYAVNSVHFQSQNGQEPAFLFNLFKMTAVKLGRKFTGAKQHCLTATICLLIHIRKAIVAQDKYISL